ncbi:MAG: hypothetical protein V8S71_09120 [Oscillospiraceae bacterium]
MSAIRRRWTFVYDYPKEGQQQPEIDLSGEVAKGTIPLFLQWDEH